MTNGLARTSALALTLAMPAVAVALDLSVETVGTAPRFVERQLVSSDGRSLDFPSDITSGEGALLISFTFTGCALQCPVSDRIVDRLAELARQEGRSDLHFATITINPLDDTPESLEARRREDGHHPDRLFLTGNPADVCAVAEGLGMPCGSAQDHLVRFILVPAGGRPARVLDDLQVPDNLYAILAAKP